MTLGQFCRVSSGDQKDKSCSTGKKSLIFRACNSGHTFVNQTLPTRRVCALKFVCVLRDRTEEETKKSQ